MKSSMRLVIQNDFDNRAAFRAAVHSLDMALAISDILNKLRNTIKYGEKNTEVYEEISSLIDDVLKDNGVDIEWILE